MTKDDFLTTLRTLIQDMPPEDRRDVMNYYTEYFEDAGPEREQEVLCQLGSPEQVAREVLGGGFAPARESAGAPKRSRGLISAIAMICAAPIALPLMAAGVLVVCCMALAALLCVGGLLVTAVAVVVMGQYRSSAVYRWSGKWHRVLFSGKRAGSAGFRCVVRGSLCSVWYFLFPENHRLGQ